MVSILFAIILGIGFTFVAIQNPNVVPLHFFDYTVILPLYIVAALSFLAGIFVTALSSLFDRTSFDLSKKETQVANLSKSNQSLQYQMNKVAEENTRLRQELHDTRVHLRGERWEHTKDRVKNFFKPVRPTSTL
jgi:uncharacterized integral membrane protein